MNLNILKSYLPLVAFCLFFSLSINAQQNATIEAITTEDGLSQGMIYDILQDREGFLWFATKDGLNRYDGYEFKVFTNDPNDPWSISGNTIVKLFEDSAGRIWAASDNTGLNIYDKKTGRFHHLRHDPSDPASLSGNHISAIVEDTSGYFITAVNMQEINMFRLEDDFFEAQKTPQIFKVAMPLQKQLEGAPNSDLRGIVKDNKDRIWVGGNNDMFQFNVPKAELTLTLENYSFSSASISQNGAVWAFGYNTLFNWDGDNMIKLIDKYQNAREVQEDSKENLWILEMDTLYGLDKAALNLSIPDDAGSGHCFFSWKPQGIKFPFNSLFIDNSGIVWVGTIGYGLYKINTKQFEFAHFLPGISIRQIVYSPENELYLQNYTSGWFKPDGVFNELNRQHPEEPDTDCILVTKSGETWTRLEYYTRQNNFQLKRYNPDTDKTQLYNISWHHCHYQPMIESLDGSIWMAGLNDVLTQIEPETGNTKSYNLKTGKLIIAPEDEKRTTTVEYSSALFEDSDGILWVGTERGFTKCIRPSHPTGALQITKYKNIPGDQNSLSYNHVSSFLDDPINPKGFLWVGTKGGGINLFDKDSGIFKQLTKKDGLPDDVVYSILTDNDGNLWGSTNKGLFCMIPKKDGEEEGDDQWNYTIRKFSSADGLQGNEFNTGAYKKLPDGRLVFGGVNGYNIFDPRKVLGEAYIPPTYITNILVNNQPVSPSDESGILQNTIETSKKITLNHQQRILTLQFASLDFNAPDRNKYRYQLVGADDTWVEAGNRRSATFLNLQPNEYTFRVQGSNSQGIWSNQIAELQISILPPWWKTWWAYITYAALIVAAIWTYFRFSINRAKLQEQLAFEKREIDRVKDLDALKTQLYMNMTHEFRTPLTIILGMAKQVQDNPKKHFNSGLNMIIRNGQNLLNLVNKMLNLSKLESGKMTLELVQGDVVYFLRNIVESFRSFAANKEIQLHFLPEVDSVMMDFDADKLQQVVSNLISNAFKFTPEGGHIYFNVRKEDSDLVIRVKDTGRGIPEADLKKVFDRFYQVDTSTTRKYDGSGIGLALSKELVNLMEGKISVQSPPIGLKKGSEFMVILPIGVYGYGYEQGSFKEPRSSRRSARHPSHSSEAEIGYKQGAGLGYEQGAEQGYEQGSFKEPRSSSHSSEAEIENEEVADAINGVPIKSENIAESPDKKRIGKNEKPLILLNEDNEDVAAYVASCLPNDFRLVIAENGQEGLEFAIEMIPDLIISDVMMPIMDGFEFCNKIKSDPRTDHIPVIILTARADMDSKIEGLELGANAYLPKPFEKQELLLTIKNLFKLRDKLQLHYQNISGLVRHIDLGDEVSVESKPEDAFVTKVREFIEEHIDDFNLSVDHLAKELHLSHSQFGRKLDALTGFSPNRFIRFTRLRKSKELLQDPDLSITAVAYDCGFSDPSYFTRVFKKEFGKTPIDWRAEAML